MNPTRARAVGAVLRAWRGPRTVVDVAAAAGTTRHVVHARERGEGGARMLHDARRIAAAMGVPNGAVDQLIALLSVQP